MALDGLAVAVETWHEHRLLILFCVVLLTLLGARYLQTQRALPRSRTPRNGERNGEKSTQQAGAVARAAVETSKDVKANLTKVRPPPRRITGRKGATSRSSQQIPQTLNKNEAIQPLLFFYSLGGSTEARAQALCNKLAKDYEAFNAQGKLHRVKPPQLLDLSDIDYDDYFTSVPKSVERESHFYMILLPSYNVDTNLSNFLEHLQETHHDFRIDTAPLRSLLGYSVFGFGDQEEWPTEAEGFCTQAIEVDKWMARLTDRKRAYPLGMGDVKGDCQEKLDEWCSGLASVISDFADGQGLGEGMPGSGNAVESEDEDEEAEAQEDDEERSTTPAQKPRRTAKSILTDVENLGNEITTDTQDSSVIPIDFTTYNKITPLQPTPTAKPMVPPTSPTYAALTKQGYSIVGSHSGIKLCRWTKSALRGRGSCYKHSFYGIASHCCMECTPSLSCSNKCVFCWRHGTNPVGTSWRWAVDDPETIFAGVTAEHYRKIKVLRGVPGVRADRYEEALRIRHCALSLVGEPIFYPHINRFLSLLHGQRISSFLVCNAQHPAQLAALDRVTQLYVSIDAADAETLRAIDRPLHRDFWPRFLACLDILRAARFRQRTVFRLTLVKGFNVEAAAAGYADLVARALPCFIEVKGVTYCGTSTSKGAGLSMANVPFYEEVCAFVAALERALAERGLDYGIGAEHAHSCCILLASARFRIHGRWHTSIDYARFFALLESGAEFAPEDYCAETVEWALWGNGGFDPADVRVKKRGKAARAALTAAAADADEVDA